MNIVKEFICNIDQNKIYLYMHEDGRGSGYFYTKYSMIFVEDYVIEQERNPDCNLPTFGDMLNEIIHDITRDNKVFMEFDNIQELKSYLNRIKMAQELLR